MKAAQTHPDLETDSDLEVDEFKEEVFFMFALPAAMLAFLGVCVAVIVWST